MLKNILIDIKKHVCCRNLNGVTVTLTKNIFDSILFQNDKIHNFFDILPGTTDILIN